MVSNAALLITSPRFESELHISPGMLHVFPISIGFLRFLHPPIPSPDPP